MTPAAGRITGAAEILTAGKTTEAMAPVAEEIIMAGRITGVEEILMAGKSAEAVDHAAEKTIMAGRIIAEALAAEETIAEAEAALAAKIIPAEAAVADAAAGVIIPAPYSACLH